MVLRNWSKGTGNKKYRVELWSHGKNSKKIRTIQFGHINYGQFKDTTPLKLYSNKNTTPLKLYSNKNTLDKKKRKAYFSRHPTNYPRYSADWLSKKYLWSK